MLNESKFKQTVSISLSKKKVVNAKQLLNLLDSKSKQVHNVKFIPPKIGSNNLGKFFVEYEW